MHQLKVKTDENTYSLQKPLLKLLDCLKFRGATPNKLTVIPINMARLKELIEQI